MPAACNARSFEEAVPALPETIAPAWPIVLPGGAVIGEPVSVPNAEALAATDPYQFQW
jgi:hypothetical protein